MDPEITELLARIAELNDEELAGLEQRIRDEFQTLRDGEIDTDAIVAMEELANALDQVTGETTRRADEAAELQRRADELAARVEPPADPPEDSPADDPADEGADPPADPPADPAADDPPGDPQAVAAGADPPAPPPAPRRRAARTTPRPGEMARTVVAAADVAGFGVGQRLRTPAEIGQAFVNRAEAARFARGNGEKLYVATVQGEYPAERILGRDPILNAQRIEQVASPQALTASGGLCAPVEVDYSLMTVSTAARPVRDSLARFGADRGGIRFIEPPVLSDLGSGVTLWTEANDQSPSNPSTKPCVSISCGSETEVVVDAMVLCIEVGNFSRRTFPEQFAAWYDLGLAQHAREAEANLLGQISTGSTAVTDGQNFGAARDLLESYARAAAQYRNRHRMDPEATIQVLLPAWALDAMVADLMRQAPGDSAMSVAREAIRGWFRDRNLAVTWYLDERAGAGQQYGVQVAGPLLQWFGTVEGYLFAPGTWLFLDGGTLNLGLEIRDSALNETNDVRAFLETFEAAANHGIESLRIRNTICVDGSASALVDGPCTGS